MRILVDLSSHVLNAGGAGGLILQAEKSPPIGSPGTPINGKFVIPVEEGMEAYIDSSSHVLPVDGTDVCSQSFALLLAQYPQYEYCYFNPLLTAADVTAVSGGLDLTAVHAHQSIPEFSWADVPLQTRVLTGSAAGMAPGSTSLPIPNPTTANPGLVMTNPITEVGSFTPGGIGADKFMVWWKIYSYEVSQDVRATGGLLNGQNTPAIKRIKEMDQEPTDFYVFLSIDDGANWFIANRLTPIAVCSKAPSVRLMFMNTTRERVYLAQYALLF